MAEATAEAKEYAKVVRDDPCFVDELKRAIDDFTSFDGFEIVSPLAIATSCRTLRSQPPPPFLLK